MGCIRQVLGTLQRQFFCEDELTKETAVNLKHVYESNRARFAGGHLPRTRHDGTLGSRRS